MKQIAMIVSTLSLVLALPAYSQSSKSETHPAANITKPLMKGEVGIFREQVDANKDSLKTPEFDVTDDANSKATNQWLPDIIFYQNNGQGHLDVHAGAHVSQSTPRGGVEIGGNVSFGDGVTIGTPERPVSPAAGNLEKEQYLIDYHDGGIRFGLPTLFRCHFFKADEAFNVLEGITIIADRVDLGDAHMLTHRQRIMLSGNAKFGYIVLRDAINNLSAEQSNQQTAQDLPGAFLDDTQIPGTKTSLISPGIYEQSTDLTDIRFGSEHAQKRQARVRYTASGANEMLVQIRLP